MKELSPREEQAMIDLAKAGDPEANYNMSLWALEHAEEEPDEDRWNRLAAKCLVKAAQAGYAPAVAKMQGLLHPAEERPAPRKAQQPAPKPRPEPAEPRFHVEEPTEPERPSALDAIKSIPGKVTALFPKRERVPRQPRQAEPRERVPLLRRLDSWDDTKWKRFQLICVIICAVLAVLIALMLINGKKKAEPAQDTSYLPAAPTAEPAAPSPTPEPAPLYPDETVRFAIQRAELEVHPEDEDFVTEPTTAVVRTSGSDLRMRQGPAADYDLIATLSNGTTVEIFAYQSGWALVKHESRWGWCSSDYLVVSQ